MSVNSVTISGNIGNDPAMRQTQSGSSVMTFSVAVSERVKRGEEWTDYTNWIDVVVFGKRAEGLSKFLAKGMKVCVCGKLRYSSWEKDGQKRSKVEVIADDVDIMQRRDASGSPQNARGGTQGRNMGNYTDGGQSAPRNGSYGQGNGYQEQSYSDPYGMVYGEDVDF